ncbi:HNH endonuclease, partial [Aspergillus brunneoviolaceus CBS 621.78]
MTSFLSTENYQVFRECLSTAIVERFSAPAQPKKARRTRGAVSQRQKTRKETAGTSAAAADASQCLPDRASPEELAEFIDFLATETFPALPPSIQTLTYTPPPPPPPTTTSSSSSSTTTTTITTSSETDPQTLASTLCTTTLPATVHDTLTTYAILADQPEENEEALTTFFTPILTEYLAAVTRPPPVWATTRTDSCEICGRDWIPLSYHHLIPRSVHAKVTKKGWHLEWMLNSVAWLCRACHSFVHRMASNEELAREWFTVERICEREDVR